MFYLRKELYSTHDNDRVSHSLTHRKLLYFTAEVMLIFARHQSLFIPLPVWVLHSTSGLFEAER